uniref:TMEM205-like domain-containing protein n=1 Tax=Cannabis sativa TaxID=3483 RepID=A0A803NNH0_CANSA
MKPKTRVSISPEDDATRYDFPEQTVTTSFLGNAKDKLKEVSSSFIPNLGQQGGEHHPRTSRELFCDAYGKCKHKIAVAIDKTMGLAHDDIDMKIRAAHTVEKAAVKGKEAVVNKARKVEEAAEEAYDKTKDSVRHVAHEVEEHAKESAQVTKAAIKGTKNLAKTIGIDVAKNVTGFLGYAGKHVAKKAAFFSGLASTKALSPVPGMMYLIGYGIAYGTSVWVTFVSSHVLAGSLPMQQFGLVQSKLYPVYFRTMASSIGTALVGFVVSHRGRALTRDFHKIQFYNLLASLSLVLINMLYFEPKATKLITTTDHSPMSSTISPTLRKKTAATTASVAIETPEQEADIRNRLKALNTTLKNLNMASSSVNILCLMSLSWHVYYLAQRLDLT